LKLEEARADLPWKHDSRPAVAEHSSGRAGNDVLIDSARKSAELKPFVCTAKTGALRAGRCEKHDASCGLPAVRLYFSKRRTFVVEAWHAWFMKGAAQHYVRTAMKLVNTPFSNNCLETKSHSILSLKLNLCTSHEALRSKLHCEAMMLSDEHATASSVGAVLRKSGNISWTMLLRQCIVALA